MNANLRKARKQFGKVIARIRQGHGSAAEIFTPAPDETPPPSVESRIVLIHHQAATGGTLISKCLAALPDTRLVSEIHPHYLVERMFSPSAPLDQYMKSYGPLPRSDIAEHFVFQADMLARAAAREGKTMIIRDHSHADYMRPQVPGTTPVRDYLADRVAASLVTYRHPLDSFLSALNSNWMYGVKNSLEEYSKRYLLFTRDYAGLPVMKYEDLTTDPESTMQQVCTDLGLTFDPAFMSNFGNISLSGDSGRSSAKISTRARRKVPSKIEAERSSEAYRTLCETLGYEP